MVKIKLKSVVWNNSFIDTIKSSGSDFHRFPPVPSKQVITKCVRVSEITPFFNLYTRLEMLLSPNRFPFWLLGTPYCGFDCSSVLERNRHRRPHQKNTYNHIQAHPKIFMDDGGNIGAFTTTLAGGNLGHSRITVGTFRLNIPLMLPTLFNKETNIHNNDNYNNHHQLVVQ